MTSEPHPLSTPDGWRLALRRTLWPEGHRAAPVKGLPVLVVPGYGMNARLFETRVQGRSFLDALAEAGFDGWTLDFRGQGESCPDEERTGPTGPCGLKEYAFVDLKAAVEHVCAVTAHPRLVAVGCSLGGSLILAYAARFGTDRLERFVGVGAPLFMEQPGALVRAVGVAGPALAVLPVRGTRTLAAFGLPLAARYAKKPLSIYLHPDHVDLSQPDRLARVVENPDRRVNAEIGRWIRTGRLVVDGLDVAEALRGRTLRTLVVVALDDGIVNPASARSVVRVLGEHQVDEIEVGGPEAPFGHADLFLSEHSDRAVFQPVIAWLKRS
ncbi:MAG: alpha/beta fold hydrolase [Deltaproteobacteria bacterium]|nr:alpha/beta fold hydrolase [Deltaproteobacteria bacterium]